MKPFPKTFGLVDCNNFYASCERIFNPKLEGKPVVVLSNNDGCIIARSEEAKKTGIKMGVPAFEINDLLEQYNVAVFSTNYALYGDISHRVMSTLAQFTPSLEIYSIDEAFLDLTGLQTGNFTGYGMKIVDTVMQWTGIPVTIGTGPTKTLAKLANHLAKENSVPNHTLCFQDQDHIDKSLKLIPVGEVWGIGSQHTLFLNKHGIVTAYDLKKANEKWIRQHMGVMGERILFELRGVSCYPVDENPQSKKAICFSRSYGTPIQNYEEIEQVTASYVAVVGEKLRKQHSVAQAMTVFIMTNKFARGPQYVNGITIQLPVATNQTAELLHHAISALKKLFRKGYLYKKSGIIVTGLHSQREMQCSLFDDKKKEQQQKISTVLDKINMQMGKNTIRYAIQGSGRRWKMRQEKLSPAYTTRWEDLPKVKMGD